MQEETKTNQECIKVVAIDDHQVVIDGLEMFLNLEKDIEFSEDFEENKRILGKTMPSKKIRNQIAGYASRMKVQEKKEKEE